MTARPAGVVGGDAESAGIAVEQFGGAVGRRRPVEYRREDRRAVGADRGSAGVLARTNSAMPGPPPRWVSVLLIRHIVAFTRVSGRVVTGTAKLFVSPAAAQFG